jgi:FtsZ-binding cell division protein ZapB
MRDNQKRERAKQDELSVENERLTNELAVSQSSLDTYSKNVEHLQMEVKNFRDNERSLLQEKEELLRSREEGEQYRRDV